MDMSFSTPSAAGHEVGLMHGLINYIDTKAKCRHLKKLTAMDMSFSTPSAAGHEVGTMHGLINYIDTKAKCRHLKKIDRHGHVLLHSLCGGA
jgi:hypothetical protein